MKAFLVLAALTLLAVPTLAGGIKREHCYMRMVVSNDPSLAGLHQDCVTFEAGGGAVRHKKCEEPKRG